ncbi:MAG: hypothetical protein HXY46_01160 [Syntrophaceae bacterium]|nr:hypothetical protein [Syntrophaceae bacterium]
MSELVGEISAASSEQAQGIEQISKVSAEMNNVTQQNAAAAEELASIMAMFRTNHDSSEILRDRKTTAQSRGRPQEKYGRRFLERGDGRRSEDTGISRKVPGPEEAIVEGQTGI